MREAPTDHLLFLARVDLAVIVLASTSLLLVDGSATEARVSIHLLELGDGHGAWVVVVLYSIADLLLLGFLLDGLVVHQSLLLILLAALIIDAAILYLVLVHLEPYGLIIYSNRN